MDIKKIAFINSGGVYSHKVNREGILKSFKKLQNIEVIGLNFRSPFCEIPLGSYIFEEGKEKKRELLEKMERLALPNVSLDFG